MLTKKVAWLTEAESAVGVKWVDFRADQNGMAAFVLWMKDKVWKVISTTSREVRETYVDFFNVVQHKFEVYLVDWLKTMDTPFSYSWLPLLKM